MSSYRRLRVGVRPGPACRGGAPGSEAASENPRHRAHSPRSPTVPAPQEGSGPPASSAGAAAAGAAPQGSWAPRQPVSAAAPPAGAGARPPVAAQQQLQPAFPGAVAEASAYVRLGPAPPGKAQSAGALATPRPPFAVSSPPQQQQQARVPSPAPGLAVPLPRKQAAAAPFVIASPLASGYGAQRLQQERAQSPPAAPPPPPAAPPRSWAPQQPAGVHERPEHSFGRMLVLQGMLAVPGHAWRRLL
jgi:hypothetical protein